MTKINNRPIETKYGEIYGRDALMVKEVTLDMYPMEIEVITSLDLLFCRPRRARREIVLISFKFTNIESLSITMIDESDYQLVKKSCFDKEKDEHYILSTYDHVFDIVGQCEVNYYK